MKHINQITAVVCTILLGGSFLIVQINKQNSIELQAQMKINQANKVLDEEREAQETKEAGLTWCLSDAEIAYWDNVKLNMSENEDGSYTGAQYKWDNAEKDKKTDEDACFKKFN